MDEMVAGAHRVSDLAHESTEVLGFIQDLGIIISIEDLPSSQRQLEPE